MKRAATKARKGSLLDRKTYKWGKLRSGEPVPKPNKTKLFRKKGGWI